MSGLPQALQNGNSQDDGDLSAQCLSKQHAAGFAEDVQVGVQGLPQPFQNDDGLLEGDYSVQCLSDEHEAGFAVDVCPSRMATAR